jgi:hypothetical protein
VSGRSAEEELAVASQELQAAEQELAFCRRRYEAARQDYWQARRNHEFIEAAVRGQTASELNPKGKL